MADNINDKINRIVLSGVNITWIIIKEAITVTILIIISFRSFSFK